MSPHKPSVLDTQFNRRTALAIGGAAGLSAVLAACGGGGGGTATSAGLASKVDSDLYVAGGGGNVSHIDWGISADIIGFDPIVSYDYATTPVVMHVCEPLLKLNTSYELEPNLAQKFTQESPTRWVYQIRKGVKFSDGSEMTAEDAAFSLNRHLDPNGGSFLHSFFVNVKSIVAKGDAVVVDLLRPDAIWAYVPMLPAGTVISKANIEATEKSGAKPGTPTTAVIGTGPYKFVSWQKGQAINLTRNPEYWDKNRALKVKNVSFKIVEDADTLASAILSDEIQGTFDLNGKAVQSLGSSEVNVLRGPSMDVRMAAFNTTKAPFDDPLVRQALSLVIDKAGLLAAAYGGEGQLWNSPIVEQQWLFSKGKFRAAHKALPSWEKDVEKAKELMAKAKPSTTTGNIIVATPEQQAQGVAVQAAGEEIGLNLEVEKVPGDQAIAMIYAEEPRKYSIVMYDWGADVPDPAANVQFPFSSKNELLDFMNYKNPTVDKLIQEQSEMSDGAARAAKLIEIQETIVGEQVWSVLYQINTLMVLNKELGGYHLHPHFWYLDGWTADLSGS